MCRPGTLTVLTPVWHLTLAVLLAPRGEGRLASSSPPLPLAEALGGWTTEFNLERAEGSR
jgi:hypothetical protein